MSDEATHAFLGKLKEDDGFRVRVLAAADAEARLEIVRAEGFDCTADEIASYARRLEDEELAGISSGDGPVGPGCEGGIGGLRECE